MIVREIKDDSEKVLETFDWFNDYKDTRLWCLGMGLDHIADELDKGHAKWIQQRRD